MKKTSLKTITIRPSRTDDPVELRRTLSQLEVDLRENFQKVQKLLDELVEQQNSNNT